jgi:hypothetical protein
MTAWAAFWNTIPWVALISFILWRYHKPISAVILALQKRIEGGGGFKVGTIEFPASSPQEQVQKKQEEVLQLLEAQASAPPNIPVDTPAQTPLPQEPTIKWESSTVLSQEKRERLFAKVSEAENLAISALQAKVGVPIARNVALAPRYTADGVYEVNGELTIVEVKYITSLSQVADVVPRAINQVRSAIGRMPRRDFQTAKAVIVLVASHSRLVQPLKDTVAMQYGEPAERVRFQVYSIYALRREFGLGGSSEVDDPDAASD